MVYSNAALHWCSDQQIHLRIVRNLLKSGGILAVQMPDTRSQPSHLLMEDAAKICGFSELIKDVRIPRAEYDPPYYHNLLENNCDDIEIWTTEYLHKLLFPSSLNQHPVSEFTSATGLQPILAAIRSKMGREDFVEKYMTEYNSLLMKAYPSFGEQEHRFVLYPFKRLFFVAKKGVLKESPQIA